MANHLTNTFIVPHFEVSIGPTQQNIDWHAHLLSVLLCFLEPKCSYSTII